MNKVNTYLVHSSYRVSCYRHERPYEQNSELCKTTGSKGVVLLSN